MKLMVSIEVALTQKNEKMRPENIINKFRIEL